MVALDGLAALERTQGVDRAVRLREALHDLKLRISVSAIRPQKQVLHPLTISATSLSTITAVIVSRMTTRKISTFSRFGASS